MDFPKPGILQKIANYFWNPSYDEFQRSVSTLSDPESWLINALGGWESTSGEKVSRNSSLGVSSIYAGLDFIASTLAQIPLKVVEYRGKEKVVLEDHPLVYILNQQGNQNQTAYEVRYQDTLNKVLDGNGIAYVERNGRGEATAIKPVMWHGVNVSVQNTDQIIYQIFENHLQQAVSLKLMPSEVLHFKAHTNRGFCGEPLWLQQKDTIGQAQAIRKSGSAFFKSGMHQKIGFIYPGHWSKEGQDKYLKNFSDKHLGVNNASNPPVFDKGVKPFVFNFSPESSQLLESQKWSVADIARILRIPSFVINDNERSTFSNIEELSTSLFKYSFQHHIESDTQEYEKVLIPKAQRGKVHIVYETQWLLKGDFETRSKWYTSMFMIGAFTVNDILKLEGMNTIGEEGDKRFVPLNYTTLEKAGTEEAQRFFDSPEMKAFEEAMERVKSLNGNHTLMK